LPSRLTDLATPSAVNLVFNDISLLVAKAAKLPASSVTAF
jgi:hypothetical protein